MLIDTNATETRSAVVKPDPNNATARSGRVTTTGYDKVTQTHGVRWEDGTEERVAASRVVPARA